MNSFATTLEQTRPVLPIRLLNGCGALQERTRIWRSPLHAVDLIETAKRRCSLDDFGGGDFFECLSRLLDSCHRESRLSLVRKIALRTDLIRALCSRLFMNRDRQLYAGVVREEIHEPLSIIGLPRSGTTLFHTLLAAGPAHPAPLTWEAMTPRHRTRANAKRRLQ